MRAGRIILLWAVVTDAWNYSGILFPAHMLSFGKYLYGYFSRILWMLPAFFLLRGCEQNLSWDRKQLFSRPKPEPIFIAFIAITAIYALTSVAMNHHSWHMTSGNLLLLTIKLLIVGIAAFYSIPGILSAE